MTEKRILMLFIFFTIFAFFIQWNMVYINISGKYYTDAKSQQFKSVYITDGRAEITDNNFKSITNTQVQLKAFVTSNQSDLQSVFEALKEKDKKQFYKNLESRKNFIVDVNKPIHNELIFEGTNRYSDFNIAQHLIGYVNSDGIGVAGLEKAFEGELKNSSQRVLLNMELNGYGEVLNIDRHIESANSTVNSKIMVLTIDNTIQRICEAIAKEYIPNGSIVVLESKTGKVKAMVSTPFYNANNLQSYLTQENSPLMNKALQAYEPGSVIKPLWAAVLLENGYNPNSKYECVGYIDVNGHIYHCANDVAHGTVDMEKALVVSCNCYFVNSRIKEKAFKFSQMAESLNFGKSIELARNYYTAQGYFPSLDEISNLGQLSSVSFGQGKFLLTPIHVAGFMNIFANEGRYIVPQVAQGIYNAENKELITNLYNLQQKQVIGPAVADKIRGMLNVVATEGAKGRSKPTYLTAGGKTGTAQTGKINEDGSEIFTAWFSGFYPSDAPQYTICISMYNGGESTRTAAPIFQKLCDSLYYLI